MRGCHRKWHSRDRIDARHELAKSRRRYIFMGQLASHKRRVLAEPSSQPKLRKCYATDVLDLAIDSASHGVLHLRNDFDTSRSPQRSAHSRCLTAARASMRRPGFFAAMLSDRTIPAP
jgi:hypothetical protein